MDKQTPARDPAKKMQSPKPCGDEVQPKAELDGKNDSGPEPEIHGKT